MKRGSTMKKTFALVAAAFALAACGNDVDVATDTATVPAIDTSAALAVPTPMDTSLMDTTRTDTTKRDTTLTP
jgi:ABC-type glycerol-3-phosphate transport system substrate-binding protein